MGHANNAIVPEFEPIPAWTKRSGMTRTGTYIELSRGNLRAIKQGRRTLIDVNAGIAWLRTLPQAEINIKGARGS